MRSIRSILPRWLLLSPAVKRIGRQGVADELQAEQWHELYVAALFENDPARTVSSITEARTALVKRARELFLAGGNHLEEQSAIDETLLALQTFERCTQHVPRPESMPPRE